MSDEISKHGASGEIIGLTSDQRERIGHLSREQMIAIIESFYESGKAIANQFTYQIGTNEILGDKNKITDEMLGNLQRSLNNLGHEIMGAEIEKIKRRYDESHNTPPTQI